jgi:hypothetical protein
MERDILMKTTTIIRTGILGFACLEAACASRVAEPTENTNSAVASVPSGSSVPGYVHALSNSKFRIGQGATIELSNSQIQRWRGSLGAFAVDPGNGAAMGVLDAKTATGPYILDEATHNASVKAYFISAGIPAQQIAGVHATFVSFGSTTISAIAAPTSTPIALESMNSILTRAIQGIPVVESTAWAKMRTSGEVDMELVFWPPIDATVVNQALAFAKQMKDPTAHSAFLSKLPRAVQKEIGVVIHHTDTTVHSAPTAYVAYDAVIDSEATAPVLHFDVNGSPLVLPQEHPTAAYAPARR